jgi:ABC-type sugar transport system ATPase subunit
MAKDGEYDSAEELLVLKDVRKNYGSVEALKGVTFSAKKGECLVVLGPSGAGKTTMLKVIAGLETVKSGEVYFKGSLMNELEPKDRNVAMVFESYALYPHVTVFENLASPLYAINMDEREIRKRVEEIALMLGIHAFLGRRPGFLSGGQRQRVALGRALVKPVDLYLMDEPIAHLDAKLRYQMIGEFKHLQETLRISIVYVTHDWREAMSLGNAIIVLNQGRVEQYGEREDIFNRPANTFVARMLGDPPMNLISGEISAENGGAVLKSGDIRIPMKEKVGGGKAILGIRSSKIRLTSVSDKKRLDAEVYSSGKHGMNTVVSMKVGTHIFKTEFREHAKFEIGQKISIQLDLAGACLFDADGRLARVLGARNG